MKTNELKAFENIPYFTISGFKQVLNADEGDSQRVLEMLSRWVHMGHIIRLKKGIYMTRRFYERHQNHAFFSSAVSSIILPQSYISLEFILQRAGILTDVTYPITAITLKNTRQIENVLGTFTYRHMKSVLYSGFSQETFYGVIFNHASTAKALFDYFYLRPLPRSLRRQNINLAEELRLNLDEIPLKEKNAFKDYVEFCASPKMDFVHENLRKTVWQP